MHWTKYPITSVSSETIFHYNKDGEDEKWNIKDEKTRW